MEGGDLRTLQLYDILVCTKCTNHSNEHEESRWHQILIDVINLTSFSGFD